MLLFGIDQKCAEKKQHIMEESLWEQCQCGRYKKHQGNVQKKEGIESEKAEKSLCITRGKDFIEQQQNWKEQFGKFP